MEDEEFSKINMIDFTLLAAEQEGSNQGFKAEQEGNNQGFKEEQSRL